jgi:hypothetical protein
MTARAPRRHVIALACVLAAATVTGGALVAVLSSQPAPRPTPVHPVGMVSKAPAASAPAVHWAGGEAGDDG